MDILGNKIRTTEKDIFALNEFLSCFPKLTGHSFHNNQICQKLDDYGFFFELFKILKNLSYKLLKINGKNLNDEGSHPLLREDVVEGCRGLLYSSLLQQHRSELSGGCPDQPLR